MIKVTHKKLESWHRRAVAVAQDSHDSETKVGALLIHGETGAVLSSGFNGFIRGANDNALPNKRPKKYPYMVHAETNLVYNCARHGVSTDGCILFCTLSPCINCLRAIWQVGISEIYFKDMYRDFKKNCEMKDLEINYQPVFRDFYQINLEPK